MLMRSDHRASAAAMLRPIAEASVRAHWLVYAARVEYVERLSEVGADTPNLDDMITELARCATPSVGISHLKRLLPTPHWRRFHKYNHGGMGQLIRRPREESFNQEECHEHLLLADIFLLAGVGIATAIFSSPDLSRFVADELARINHEGVTVFGKEDGGPWQGLPRAPDWDGLLGKADELDSPT